MEDPNKFEKYRAHIDTHSVPIPVAKEPTRCRKYLGGLIPWAWLCAAARLPGRAFHVGIIIRFLLSVTKKSTFPLSGARLREFGINRNAGYRALKWLERAGLIQVVRHPGRQPRITVLEAPVPALDPGGENEAP